MTKVKVKVSPGKGSGEKLTVQRIRLERMRNPSGTKIYKTKARIGVHITTSRNGAARQGSRL